MTTIAAVWTHAQLLDGMTIKGNALGLRIAAGNIPNFIDVETGGWAAQSKTHSIATRPRRWPTSPPWPICLTRV